MGWPGATLATERLVLRRWSVVDAPALKSVLDANVEHLTPWIPWAVAAPGTVEEIEARIELWSRRFDDGREWIWAIWAEDGAKLLGAVGIYPRNAEGRVAIAEADRAEIGYWLRRDATGRGYATEAARAAVEFAKTLTGISRIEMRCDPANATSIAVPKRLGFREVRRLVETSAAAGDHPRSSVVWESALDAAAGD